MLAACIGLATLLTAHAQADEIPTYDVRVGHGLGVMSTESGGVTLDGRALLRAHVFGIGGHVAGSSWLFTNSLSAAMDAGFVWRAQRVRFELLGRLGKASYDSIGGTFIDHDPGVNPVLPFAGGELNGAYLWQRRAGRNLMLGGSVVVERDLRHETIAYDHDFNSREEQVGWTRVGALVTLGMQFDLGWGKAPQGTKP